MLVASLPDNIVVPTVVGDEGTDMHLHVCTDVVAPSSALLSVHVRIHCSGSSRTR
jgi:hypothetical protein